jgi:Tfp pilus assembly protein PilV
MNQLIAFRPAGSRQFRASESTASAWPIRAASALGGPPAHAQVRRPVAQASFTLLEVLVACAIFFMAVFAVLGVLTQGLGAARSLQQREPDAGALAAALSLTNRLEEGSAAGDFEDIAPGLYPGYSWTRDVYEVGSNGLFQVDFTVIRRAGKGRGPSATQMSILLYRPGSPAGSRFRSGG